VAGQRPGDAADLAEVGGGDHRRGLVADLPQLGERELQQRQAAARAGLDQLVDERLGLEADALGLRRADDRLAGALRRERAQEVDRPPDLVAEPGIWATRVRKSPRTVATTRRPGMPRGQAGEHRADGRDLLGRRRG
jgi:hypothetical protein